VIDVTYGVRGSPPHAAIPPFTRRQIRTVDLELLRRRMPSGLRLEAFHVAPVTELALRVTPDDIVIEDARHPELNLGR
jgi:pyridoxine 5'-phosphate synthase PdxJ